MIYLESAAAPLRPFLGKRLEEKSRGLSFDQDAPFDGKPTNAKLDLLALGEQRGVRDLSPYGGGLLILAGPAYEPIADGAAGKTGNYSIYAWDRRNEPRLLVDLPPFAEDDKPLRLEALLPLRTRTDGGLGVLVLFDGATEGGPRLVRIPR